MKVWLNKILYLLENNSLKILEVLINCPNNKYFILIFLDVYSRKIVGLRHKPNNNKIVGGYNATIEQFPYQVLLIVSKGGEMYGCGGSIISDTVILTAAHCIAG